MAGCVVNHADEDQDITQRKTRRVTNTRHGEKNWKHTDPLLTFNVVVGRSCSAVMVPLE